VIARSHASSYLSSRAAALARRFRDSGASQIVEFAVSLPLLVVFVVGIYDFSGAVTLKQKLTNAAREGARIAASDPASDLADPPSVPVSVMDAYYVIDSYILAEQMSDCGLSSVTPKLGPTLTWSATASTCPGGTSLVLTINRGCWATESNGTVDTVNTCVTIQYPYKWQFTGVSGLFGNNFTPTSSITTSASAFNEN
jgi:Flp pilus assembly protein TadG